MLGCELDHAPVVVERGRHLLPRLAQQRAAQVGLRIGLVEVDGAAVVTLGFVGLTEVAQAVGTVGARRGVLRVQFQRGRKMLQRLLVLPQLEMAHALRAESGPAAGPTTMIGVK